MFSFAAASYCQNHNKMIPRFAGTVILWSDKSKFYYNRPVQLLGVMMTSSNENIFRFIGPLWGESTGNRCIPLTKASGEEILYFLWSAPDQTVEQTIETPVILDAIALIMTSP